MTVKEVTELLENEDENLPVVKYLKNALSNFEEDDELLIDTIDVNEDEWTIYFKEYFEFR